MTKSVAILGCGPAGLLATHAAEISGWAWRIYSRKRKSPLYGAQYLHDRIPQLDCGSPTTVRYALRGTPEQYRRKVYGDGWDGTVSPEDFLSEHPAWDIRYTYNGLWDRYQDEVREVDILWSSDRVLGKHLFAQGMDLVISTVPRKIWAQPGDEFLSTKVWALGDTDTARRVQQLNRPPDDSVYCCGTDEHAWYRVSNIFGYCTMEWPFKKPYYTRDVYSYAPAKGASIVEKPLSHNSKAASDFVHLGRFGAWQKGVLTTDAFTGAMAALAGDKL